MRISESVGDCAWHDDRLHVVIVVEKVGILECQRWLGSVDLADSAVDVDAVDVAEGTC